MYMCWLSLGPESLFKARHIAQTGVGCRNCSMAADEFRVAFPDGAPRTAGIQKSAAAWGSQEAPPYELA